MKFKTALVSSLIFLAMLSSCGASPQISNTSVLSATSTFYTYTCYPSRNNPVRDRYTLKVNKNKTEILLGYVGGELKQAKQEAVTNEFILFRGSISQLRGDGYLDAMLKPELLTGGSPLQNGKGGQMLLSWGGAGAPLTSSYLCVSR